MSTQFDKLLPLLVRGGVAGNIHGSARLTFDVGVVYGRSRGNLKRIVNALQPVAPYLRGAPPGLPFNLDLQSLRNGLNFTLTTSLGDLDLLGEVPAAATTKRWCLTHSSSKRLA